jgi:hypothetical protein
MSMNATGGDAVVDLGKLNKALLRIRQAADGLAISAENARATIKYGGRRKGYPAPPSNAWRCAECGTLNERMWPECAGCGRDRPDRKNHKVPKRHEGDSEE